MPFSACFIGLLSWQPARGGRLSTASQAPLLACGVLEIWARRVRRGGLFCVPILGPNGAPLWAGCPRATLQLPMTTSPYRGALVALATRHGKERVIAPALRHGLGAELLHVATVDTDALGSFCGSVPRVISALEACERKAVLAAEAAGLRLAIASEGSFTAHPRVPMLSVGIESMLFLDRDRGLTIVEQRLCHRTNHAHRLVCAADLVDGHGSDDLVRWLMAVGFPRHALIVRPSQPDQESPRIWKGVSSQPALLSALPMAMHHSSDGCAQVETDMRAHCNPTRMAAIRRLSFKLIRRIRSLCPACGSPGWGLLRSEPGLPCSWCQQPTELVLAEWHGCGVCHHQVRQPRRDGLQAADPGHCLACNP
mgnify:CR=1 FL=1